MCNLLLTSAYCRRDSGKNANATIILFAFHLQFMSPTAEPTNRAEGCCCSTQYLSDMHFSQTVHGTFEGTPIIPTTCVGFFSKKSTAKYILKLYYYQLQPETGLVICDILRLVRCFVVQCETQNKTKTEEKSAWQPFAERDKYSFRAKQTSMNPAHQSQHSAEYMSLLVCWTDDTNNNNIIIIGNSTDLGIYERFN